MSHQCASNNTVGEHGKVLAKVNANNIHCSFFVCMASPLIMEGNCVGQAWFAPHSFVLAVPSPLPILHAAGNGFQGNLLNHLPRDGGETNQPVAPEVLLTALLEVEYNVISEPILYK